MARRLHGTLVAATVATKTLDGPIAKIAVVNLTGGSDPIFFTISGTDPTDGGAETYSVAAAASAYRKVDVDVRSGSQVAVKLISAGTPEYTVEAIDDEDDT